MTKAQKAVVRLVAAAEAVARAEGYEAGKRDAMAHLTGSHLAVDAMLKELEAGLNK